jgi:hypothetical protein
VDGVLPPRKVVTPKRGREAELVLLAKERQSPAYDRKNSSRS